MSQKAALLLCLALSLGVTGAVWADLVGHWCFDEGAGNQAADATGRGHAGTIDGAVWSSPSWNGEGTCLQFDGSNDVVVVAHADDLRFNETSAFTIAVWVKMASRPGRWTGIVTKGRDIGNWYGIWINDGNRWVFGHQPNNQIGSEVEAGVWTHVSAVYDNGNKKIYLNGALDSETTALATGDNAGDLWFGAAKGVTEYAALSMDDVRIYNHALTEAEIQRIVKGVADIPMAIDPTPEDGQTDVPRDVVLGWIMGRYAATHDVYFGTDFTEVDGASRDNPMGVLVRRDHEDAQYDPDDLLAYGQTYYWRVDEVNGAPEHTIYKGLPWSFTTERYAYPVTPVAATASSSGLNMGPENTINGSGLDASDQHSTEATTMWTSAGTLPNWIRYEFDKAYKLHELWVWNSNQLFESYVGFGARNVTIEYSLDGQTWTALEGVPEFVRASGVAPCAADTTIDLGGITAQFVRLTIDTNWGGTALQTGLSEVRFFYVPMQAFAPVPADNATGVRVASELDWRPGREATSHLVYFGTDSDAVANGTLTPQTVTHHGYTPADLTYGTEYFWRVDEVGDTGTQAGDIWSFRTEEYAVVDDFESYDDDIDAQTTIWHAWTDGLSDKKSGSQVGYDNSPFAEKKIIHSGSQSMPLAYDNTSFPFSEATRTLDPAQDWTVRGIQSLSISFHGEAGSTGQLYVKINGTKVVYDGDEADLTRFGWQAWNIDLSAIGNASNISSLTIGVSGSGAAGLLYIDDIRLYPRTPEYIIPAQPASTHLMGHYAFDEESGVQVGDSSGRGHHGTFVGDPQWTAGMIDGALSFGGDGDYVDLGNPTDWPAGFEPRSLCGWAMTDGATSAWRWIVAYGTGVTSQAMFIGLYGSTLYGGGYGDDLSVPDFWKIGVWHHIALTYDGTTARLYADGVEVASAPKTWNLVHSLARIGQQVSNDAEFWYGDIDDVRIYSQTLSAEEVAGLAGQTEPRHKPF